MKCAHGGPIYCAHGCYAKGGEALMKEGMPMNKSSISKLDASEIAKSIRAKKMAKGGEVEDDDDFEEMPSEEPADDFLTADEPEESEEDKKKARMMKVMSSSRMKRISR